MTQPALDPITALGQMLWLCTFTPNYTQMPLGKVAANFQEAIETNQFRLYRAADDTPLACVCWKWLHEEHEDAAIAALMSPHPDEDAIRPEWFGGNRLWFFNFIAPFGHARDIAHDLRFNVFPGQTARAFRIDRNGNLRKFAVFQQSPRQVEPA